MRNQDGQTLLTLLIIMSIVSLLFTHIAILSLSSLSTANEARHADALLLKAEGYLESAALRYLRDPTYTGEVLIEGDYSCTIVISDLGGLDRDLESECTRNNRTKTVGMTVNYSGGIFGFSKITER